MPKGKGLTSDKAKKILSEGTANGKKLSPKQKRFFGAIAGGEKPYKDKGQKGSK